ncbi:hypothetical protein J2848_005845 [Azospirillum lipoferum]|uniref:hypothetical protein n=1 Tax=Azospirillum TaxID=191 RepID=UPI001FEBFC1D|nr:MULTISPECIES: hypothetical protein [Azospirillum]MCP1614142.1 hypothetical protein [Azospirillum lipoferum]MDW5536828.1 hypothetical protein [Azospirillum sp. NL1]
MRRIRLGIRPALLLAASLFTLATEAAAMSPLPFFQRVERVGLLCAVDADGGPAADIGDEALCGRAAAVLSGLLASGPAVAALVPNDVRIADPGTLLVLVHATLRPESGKRLLALAATLQRSGSASDAPFFMTPPQALALSGSLDESLLDSLLRRLLTPLAGALRVNP